MKNLACFFWACGTLVLNAAESCKVEARRNAQQTWSTYEAVTVDAIPGFVPSADPALDEFGGWQGTHVGNSDGFFRVRKIEGRWWMVDPAGNLFLSKAIACLTPGWSNRQQKKLKEVYGTKEAWAESEVAFVKQQGFNSAGCWSSADSFHTNRKARIPYTVYLPAMLTYNRQLKKSGQLAEGYAKGGWEGFPWDVPCVFDDAFDIVADKVISQASTYADDPYLMGYFIDNELPWKRSALWMSLCKMPKDHPSQKAAQAWLDARKGKKNARMGDATEEDRREFLAYCLDVYMGKVTKILRKYDTNHMFLGSRFHSWSSELTNAPFFKVAGKYADVISINHYSRWQPDVETMKKWGEWSGRPFMVTEFYTKGEDSGLPNKTGAGWNVRTQNDRGLFYENFCSELLKGGTCVGWHWFKYMDNDPENLKADPSNRDSNKGIVAWDFKRYDELLKRMKRFNDSTYNLARFHEKAMKNGDAK